MTRPLGRPNRNKDFLLSRLQAMYGDDFNPIMCLAENASIVQQRIREQMRLGIKVDNGDLAAAFKHWAELAKYVEPQLKAVEISGEVKADVDVAESIESVRALLVEHGISIDDL